MGNSSPKRARARAEQGVGLLVDELDGGNLRSHVVVGRRTVTVSRNVSSRRARKHQQQADLLRHAVEAPAHVGRTHALAQLDLPARQVGVDEHVGVRGHGAAPVPYTTVRPVASARRAWASTRRAGSKKSSRR